MVTTKIKKNAHKIAYIAYSFKDLNLFQIVNLLHMPGVDINAAIWYAQEIGLIELKLLSDGKYGNDIEKVNAPTEWVFGDDINDLTESILYCVTNLAKDEVDIEEKAMDQWLAGYPHQDILVAIQLLLESEALSKYVINDKDEKGTDNKYSFYTLTENKDKQWGKKQFKVDPTESKGKKKGQTVH